MTNNRADQPESPAADQRDELGGGASFPIVGVGASAGGLEAFTELLKHLPLNTGMGFVLIQHLDPQHESALTQLLARATSLAVREVTNNLRVEANRVYVIPPNTYLAIAQGVLKLLPRKQARTPHHSIDFFFESLAQDQRERAIGVILSGTATDGTLGLEAIKAEGGITFAQDESARYDSMPRSAAAAGCVDFVLSPESIAKELARIAKHPYVAGQPAELLTPEDDRASATVHEDDETPLPSGGRGTPRTGAKQARAEAARGRGAGAKGAQNGFKKILLLLRNHSGVDFSLYKSTTIQRRIVRRMVLNKQSTPETYANLLRGNAKELDALYSDVLISVTSFFRNPEAFDVVKRTVFPKLLRQQSAAPLRVWVLGCSTGQEAYSIAMAFVEATENAPRMRKLQVFATDLNDALLDKARHGLYAKSLAHDLSPERLRRFFVEEEGGYRINKLLREMVVFARQNLIDDPPFSRIDLISCRNLLIYLEPSLQKKALPTFHYALKPEGYLFLGASESIGTFTDLFEPVDKTHKIYSKKAAPTPAFHLPVKKARGEQLSPDQKRPSPLATGQENSSEGWRAELNAQREADRVTVNQFAPPGVLINAELQILQFRGPTSAYLQPPTGKATFDVLKMAREGLMLPLRAAINKAKKENKSARKENVRVIQNSKTRTVNVEVIPLKNLRERCFLILFEDAEKAGRVGDSARSPKTIDPRGGPRTARPTAKEESRRVTDLERELSETRDYLQSIQGQHEAADEELQAANEEVQSANEELQSINEELETSKEELESANEELTTVNEEMANRNIELNRLNSDLTNLQSSTKLAIVLLGRDLAIRRFSAQAEKQLNLLASDVGRAITGVRHNLDLPDLEAVVTEVIATLRERESEVQDKEGRWYSLRVRPYLTLDNKVDGAVLVLVDIDALKRAERLITEAREHAEGIIRTVPDPLVVLHANLRVDSANEAFYKTFKLSSAETEGRLIFDLDHGSWSIPKLRQLLEDIIPRNSFFNDLEIAHEFERIGRRTMLFNARTLLGPTGKPKRVLLGIRDISEVLAFQAELRRSELRYRRLFEAAQDGVLILDPQTRKIVDANPFIAELLGYTREELSGKELFEIGLHKDRAASETAFRRLQAQGPIRYEDLPLRTKMGERRDVEFISNLYSEDGERIIQCNIRDITERKKAERALFEQARLLDLSNDAIIVHDVQHRIVHWNHGAEELYGWPRQEALGKIVHSLLQTESPIPLEQIIEELYRHNRWTGELVQTKRDGQRVTVLSRWTLDRDQEGNPAAVLATNTDITERKQAEEALREAGERRNEFLAMLAHELRGPLAPIRNMLEIMKRANDNADLIEQARSTMEKQLGQMTRLIDDLFDVSRISRGKLDLRREQVELASVLHPVVEAWRPAMECSKHELALTLPPQPVYLHADPVRLAQVFGNLLSNACKYSEPGSRIALTAEQQGGDVVVSVKDTGIGIPPDMLHKIFEMFMQVDQSLERSQGGLGIGLTLVKQLVEMHGGSVQAFSEGPGRGSEFVVRLPVLIEKPKPKPQPPERTGSEPTPATGHRILVVDDNRDSAHSLAMLLRMTGNETHTAHDGLEALDAAATLRPDVVLLDIGLPKLNGYDACRKIRQQPWGKGMVLIALTGWGQEEDRLRSKGAGFNGHLVKPVDHAALMKLLAESRPTPA